MLKNVSLAVAAPKNDIGEQTQEQHHIANSKTDKKTDAPSANVQALSEARTIRRFKWILACVALFSANFLYGLNTTIIADIQAVVAQTFNDISKLGWLGIEFTLESVTLILPLRKAYAIFDTK